MRYSTKMTLKYDKIEQDKIDAIMTQSGYILFSIGCDGVWEFRVYKRS